MHLFYLYLSFVLCSLCCYVLSHSSHSNFFLLTTRLKGKMDSSHCHSHIRLYFRFFCVRVSSWMSIISTHWSLLHFCRSFPVLHCITSHFYTLFSSSSVVYTFFFSFLLSFFSLPLRLRVARHCPLVKAPSHCKRMSLSHRKQSAFIMSYLPGPPRQQSWYPGTGNVFEPVARRVKVCGSGK